MSVQRRRRLREGRGPSQALLTSAAAYALRLVVNGELRHARVRIAHMALVLALVTGLGGACATGALSNARSTAGPTRTPRPTSTPVVRPAPVPATAEMAVVGGAVDGDTIVVDWHDRLERVQMIGVNAPESAGQYSPAECFGKEAAEAVDGMAQGVVWLEFDATQGQRNGVGDLQAYVWLSNGSMLNLSLLEAGLARETARTTPYRRQSQFRTAQALARDGRVGLWAPDACGESDASGTPASVQPGQDMDCPDFSTWEDAQRFFLQQGGPASDPYLLDPDRDGVACNELQHAP